MNTIHTTRRGALLSAVLAAVAAFTKPLTAKPPAPPNPRRTWRKLGEGDFYRADDLGCAVNPEVAASQMLAPGCPIDNRHTVHTVSNWMVGEPFGILSSPDPERVFWWRAVDDGSPRPRQILWARLKKDEPLQPGDFWASQDPNTPHLQGSGDYTLRMHPVYPGAVGYLASSYLPGGTGSYWRVVGMV